MWTWGMGGATSMRQRGHSVDWGFGVQGVIARSIVSSFARRPQFNEGSRPKPPHLVGSSATSIEK